MKAYAEQAPKGIGTTALHVSTGFMEAHAPCLGFLLQLSLVSSFAQYRGCTGTFNMQYVSDLHNCEWLRLLRSCCMMHSQMTRFRCIKRYSILPQHTRLEMPLKKLTSAFMLGSDTRQVIFCHAVCCSQTFVGSTGTELISYCWADL